MKKLTYFLSAAVVALSLTSCSEDVMEMSTDSAYNVKQYQNGSIERIGDPTGPQIGEEMIIQMEDQVSLLEFQAQVQIMNVQQVPDGQILLVVGETRYGRTNEVLELEILIKDDNTHSLRPVSISFDELTAKENRSLYMLAFTNRAGAVL